jgi:putative hydrolase of the HAD superfamily
MRVSDARSEIDALLFDFGGVLVEIDFDRVYARWAELAGVDTARVTSHFTHGESHERFERGETDARGYYRTLREDLGLDLDDAQWADGWSRVFGPEIAETVALLPRLAPHVPLHLFSNTNLPHHALWSVRHAAAIEPTQRRFLSFEMGRRKPERESFERIGRELGVPLGRILFFDDSLANVEGARSAGLKAVHVRKPEDVRRAVAPWLEGAAR